ncbi:hypothetical protein HDU86_003343 [Geranomyces michiganensis]|nr:hypothetical protein HDU86_003343 [Geranomyces michiganensis]
MPGPMSTAQGSISGENKAKTLAKRRSRSLSVWKDDLKWGRAVVVNDDFADDAPYGRNHHQFPTPVRRSRSLSPVALAVEVKHVRDTKTAPKRREARLQPPSARRSSTAGSWSSSRRLSMPRTLKVHPSTVSLTDLTAGVVPTPVIRPASNPSSEPTPTALKIDVSTTCPRSVMDSVNSSVECKAESQPPKPRLPLLTEQAIYASAYRKIMDPTRPASARMTIANLMQYIQSVHPGVEALSDLGDPTWCLPNHSTSAPWKRDSSKSSRDLPRPASLQKSQSQALSARLPVIKKPPSPVAVARRNNRKRLAKLAAGIRLGPGPSCLRKELIVVGAAEAAIGVATALPPTAGSPKRVSSIQGLFSKRSLPQLGSTSSLVDPPSRGRSQSLRGSRINFQIIPAPASGFDKPAATGLKRMWRMIKQTLMLRDPVKRAQRRESAFYCTVPETSPRSQANVPSMLAPGTVDIGFAPRRPCGKEIL